MELKELCEQTLCIFEISDIKDLQSKLFECVKNNDVKKIFTISFAGRRFVHGLASKDFPILLCGQKRENAGLYA